jgi:hypothetical protein
MPLSSRMVSRVVSASSGKPSTASHGKHAARATPWPRFVPGRVRLLPRIVPVVSVIKTMARRALTSHAGDLSAAVHGAPPCPSSPSAAASLSPSHVISAAHSESNGCERKVPFRGLFLLKRPPIFIFLNPPSLAYSQNTHSQFKDVVSSV